jgi:hypothetical protein
MLGDTEVGLPQCHPVLGGQAVETPDRGVQQLGVGRERDVLGLHRGVDRDPLIHCDRTTHAFNGVRRVVDARFSEGRKVAAGHAGESVIISGPWGVVAAARVEPRVSQEPVGR